MRSVPVQSVDVIIALCKSFVVCNELLPRNLSSERALNLIYRSFSAGLILDTMAYKSVGELMESLQKVLNSICKLWCDPTQASRPGLSSPKLTLLTLLCILIHLCDETR